MTDHPRAARSAAVRTVVAGPFPAAIVPARRMPLESESVLLRKVTVLARIHGWRAYHTHRSDRSEAGWPDLALCKRGRPLILAELKTARGRLSAAQQGWLSDLATCQGVLTFVWRPADIPGIAEVLAA